MIEPPSADRFSASDFVLLQTMASGAPEEVSRREPAIEQLWSKAEHLIDRLGSLLFAGAPFRAAVWPDTPEDERLPFIWARLKRADASRYATHIGLFLAPGSCNICVDLEKDRLDDGSAAESLEQVLDFYRQDAPGLVGALGRADARVWTDPDNVVAASAFPGIDLDAFMAANQDAGHPWPRLGYLLDSTDIEAFGERCGFETAARAATLVGFYDAMIGSFAEPRLP